LNKSLLVLKGKLLKVEEWLIRYENHSRSQRKFEYIVDKQVAFLHNHHNGKFNTSILERKKLEHNVRRNIADEDKLIGMKAKRAGLICQISVLENAINSSKTGDA
jgi:hypothetical protein